ncbi:MAG: bifunctional glutamate N-acetyltransferase/amino-acid acetyltransferase ArgJ [Candidatus Sumerlaeales bacterium]|nr:bifunctional glutamate N-acetyltransferase/amino-acid acetyltransferase ArgJ [Candidatus Sumerlaeales bacterium]
MIKTPFTFEELTLPQGFSWGGAEAAVKHEGRLDVGLLYADAPCVAAATFTQNAFAAAPVLYSKDALMNANNTAQCIVVNSGCANAATGEQGFINAQKCAQIAGKSSNVNEEHVLVCSTGTIGVQLPMDRMEKGINAAALDLASDASHFERFVRSIMTTDTVPKAAGKTFNCGGEKVSIVGCCKGSGMIHPMMATMLGFVATDAIISSDFLQVVFRRCIERSFNCVTVDGDTSTNDTAIILASGKAGKAIAPNTVEALEFETALCEVMQSMARQMARDGEGASKLVEIVIKEAKSFEDSRLIGYQIANSPLVKTALFGNDANWGRIACAIGNAPVKVNTNTIGIFLGDIEMMCDGEPLPFDEDKALKILQQEEVKITVTLGLGKQEATVWTCDLTNKYIEINGCYRT